MAPIPRNSLGAFQYGKRLRECFDGMYLKEGVARPNFEKMTSCELSVEETSDSEDVPPYVTTLKSTTSSCKEKLLDLQPKLVVDLPPEKASFVDQEDKVLKFKLGALDPAKTRAPIEHDDFTVAPQDDTNKQSEKQVEEIDKPLTLPAEKKLLPKKKKKTLAEEKPSGIKEKLGEKAFHKRHSIGKQKKNIHVILDTSEQHSVKKRIKKRSVQKRQRRTSQSAPSFNKCVDSGVSTGSSYKSDGGSNDAGSENNSGNSGGASRGGAGFFRQGGAGGGGHGGDDSERKNPFDVKDVSMEDEEEKDDDKSKDGSSMDCNEGNEQVHSTKWETFPFQTQNVQHSAYCSKDNCDKPLCQQMKREVVHMVTHESGGHCLRCVKLLNLIKLHARLCKRPCCRVHNCNKLREDNDIAVVDIPVPPVHQVPVYYFQPAGERNVDGHLVFNNTGLPVESPFQENMSYQKGEHIGKGGNAHIYKVQFPPSSPLSKLKIMVVKETEYVMTTDERDIYKTMGDHPNIVQHFIVTMKGQNGKANIFMEECDMSLRDFLKAHGPMNDEEAWFYWSQVVDAIVHLHKIGIIHKDIKAQNVLLSGRLGNGEYFRVKLADFDAARILKDELTKPGLNPRGTRGFASPEVMGEQPHGRPADIYSLGGLLMELKGITPREGQLYSQVKQLTETSPQIGEIVNHCVQQEPSQRPTAAELQTILRELLVVPAEL